MEKKPIFKPRKGPMTNPLGKKPEARPKRPVAKAKK